MVPVNVGDPEKLGLPVKVPFMDPPAFIFTAPLKLVVPLNVLVPVNVLFPFRNMPTWKLSTVHCRLEGEPHVPPPARTTL
jgi:hypothetical protein